jgi:hypothetical protein
MTRGDSDASREIMVLPTNDIGVVPVQTPETDLGPTRFTQRLRGTSRQEVEAAYVAARDAWTAAMKAANSGRAADLASLALAQEAYEAASVERSRWIQAAPTTRRAIPVDGSGGTNEIDMVVRQELDWKRVQNEPPRQRGFKGFVKRVLGD